MEPKSYGFKFNELNITRASIEELMGYIPGHSPEPIPDIIDEGLVKAPELCSTQGGFIFAGDLHRADDRMSITVDDIIFNTHRIVTNQLIVSIIVCKMICFI